MPLWIQHDDLEEPGPGRIGQEVPVERESPFRRVVARSSVPVEHAKSAAQTAMAGQAERRSSKKDDRAIGAVNHASLQHSGQRLHCARPLA